MKLLEDILEERVDGAVTEKNSKAKAQTKFKQLAPQMAALGFTWTGKRAHNFKTVSSYWENKTCFKAQVHPKDISHLFVLK